MRSRGHDVDGVDQCRTDGNALHLSAESACTTAYVRCVKDNPE